MYVTLVHIIHWNLHLEIRIGSDSDDYLLQNQVKPERLDPQPDLNKVLKLLIGHFCIEYTRLCKCTFKMSDKLSTIC